MAPGCERSRPVVAGPGGAYAVALRSMHGGLCPVSYAPSPAPRARVSRVLLPAASSPCSASCVLRPASCTPCPRARAPCPCPRPRFTCSVFRVPRSAFCVPRPTPASSVFRVPRSAFCVPRPTPASSVFRTPRPRPRTRGSCAPCPCPRLLRSADGSPRSAPYLPPPHFGAAPSGFGTLPG